jgi:hypothetical protein
VLLLIQSKGFLVHSILAFIGGHHVVLDEQRIFNGVLLKGIINVLLLGHPSNA